MKSVAILGCGPAGLMVAHAAKLSGWDFRIFSKKQKSRLFGAQYLHQPIPELPCGGPWTVTYELRGTPEQYRRKVYGLTWDGTVSPEDYDHMHSAWDLRAAYEHLWFTYGDEIAPVEIVPQARKFTVNTWPADLVISTIPRTVWDDDSTHFESTKIWAIGDGDYERVHLYRPGPFHVICDATPKQTWYRVSNIFGYCTMEWPYLGLLGPDICPARGSSVVTKPLRYTGDAANDIIHLGRFGAWEKGILTSDVFFQAMKVFANDTI